VLGDSIKALSRNPPGNGAVEALADLLHYLDELQPVEITAVTREIFVAVGSTLFGGGRVSATLSAGSDKADKLASCAYRFDKASDRWVRGELAVEVGSGGVRWEAVW
jgi:hypothetical protein